MYNMDLQDYAEKENIQYKSAWIRFKKGKIKGAYKTDDGRIIVPDSEKPVTKAAIYVRIPSGSDADIADEQIEELRTYAGNHGYDVVRETVEASTSDIARRIKLEYLLQDRNWDVLIVKSRASLVSMNFKLLESILKPYGRKIETVHDDIDDEDHVMENLDMYISSIASKLYGTTVSSEIRQKVRNIFNSYKN